MQKFELLDTILSHLIKVDVYDNLTGSIVKKYLGDYRNSLEALSLLSNEMNFSKGFPSMTNMRELSAYTREAKKVPKARLIDERAKLFTYMEKKGEAPPNFMLDKMEDIEFDHFVTHNDVFLIQNKPQIMELQSKDENKEYIVYWAIYHADPQIAHSHPVVFICHFKGPGKEEDIYKLMESLYSLTNFNFKLFTVSNDLDLALNDFWVQSMFRINFNEIKAPQFSKDVDMSYVQNPKDRWLLSWSIEKLILGTVREENKLFGRRLTSVFHKNNLDEEAMARGASDIEKHVLAPFSVIKKVKSEGRNPGYIAHAVHKDKILDNIFI